MNIIDRLIVSADFASSEYKGSKDGERKVLTLAQSLRDTKAILKIGSPLKGNYALIKKVHDYGLRVCADIKLHDDPRGLASDVAILNEYEPDFLTVTCSSGLAGLTLMRACAPKIKILGVTVLAHTDEGICRQVHNQEIKHATLALARIAHVAGIEGIVLSPKLIPFIQDNILGNTLTFNAPSIRPPWGEIFNDDQQNPITIQEALQKGASRVMIGRSITTAKPNSKGFPQSPHDAFKRALQEIKESS